MARPANTSPCASQRVGVGKPLAGLITPLKQIARVVLLRLEINQEASLVACVHMPSHRHGHQDEPSLHDVAVRYKKFILEAGGQPLASFGNRIAVMGDFNMNPFDLGMLQPMSFYAVNNQAYVRHTRLFVQEPEVMFYNPCWALLSDYDPGQPGVPKPSGSTYYGGTPSKKLYWHLYDQVIVSERLMDRLVPQELRIAPHTSLQTEVQSNIPRKKAIYSDHLPLQFTLNL